MSEARRIIEVDGFDHRLMVKGLSEFRNELIEQQLPTEDVNKLFLFSHAYRSSHSIKGVEETIPADALSDSSDKGIAF